MSTATRQRPDPRSADVEALARYFRVLADPTRLRIVERLTAGEASVSQLVDAIGAPQSRVSNHLACLRWCRLVESRRQGRRVFYRLAEPRVAQMLGLGRELSAEHCDHLAGCSRIGPDWV